MELTTIDDDLQGEFFPLDRTGAPSEIVGDMEFVSSDPAVISFEPTEPAAPNKIIIRTHMLGIAQMTARGVNAAGKLVEQLYDIQVERGAATSFQAVFTRIPKP